MTEKPNVPYVEHTVEELKRLRYWFAGFAAAGGKIPLCEDALRKATQAIEDHVLKSKS